MDDFNVDLSTNTTARSELHGLMFGYKFKQHIMTGTCPSSGSLLDYVYSTTTLFFCVNYCFQLYPFQPQQKERPGSINMLILLQLTGPNF